MNVPAAPDRPAASDPSRPAPLRIGLLHPYRLLTSGSGVYLVRVMRELLSRGHRLTLLSHDERPVPALFPGPDDDSHPGTWSARTLRAAGTPTAYPRAEEPGSALFRDLSDQDLQRYLDYHVAEVSAAAGEFDVLHVNGEVPMSWVGAQVKERTGVPYVVVAHGSTLEYVARVDPRFEELARTGLTRADAVVALNAEVRQRVLAVAPQAHVVTVPVGVDTGVFAPRPVPADRPPTIAYVGRLSIDKGVLHLLGAMPELARRMPEVRLVVVGDGLPIDVLAQMVDELRNGRSDAAVRLVHSHSDPSEHAWATDLLETWRRCPPPAGQRFEVEFRGRLDEHGVAAALADADVAVVPSLVHEAFPLVVLEGLAVGLPPLATDAGGLSAVLDEIAPALGAAGPLLRLPPPEADLACELPVRAAQLLEHVRDSQARGALRESCRRLAEQRYSWRAVVDGLEELYARIGRPGYPGAALLDIREVGNAVLARLPHTDQLTAAEAERFDTEAERWDADAADGQPAGPVVLDLSGLHILDGAGIGALVRWHRRLQERGSQLRLAAPGREVDTMFQLLRLHRLFEVYDRVEAALADEGLPEL